MKKKSWITLIAVLLSIGLVTHLSEKGFRKKSTFKKRVENVMEPNEMMMDIRSYPDNEFDFRAYQKAVLLGFNNNGLESRSNLSLAWNVEGPGNIGGRFNCTAVHPTNPNIIYAGAAAGGVFKTIDGGLSWNPIFDNQAFLTVGCITIDPNNSNTIWVGTGDPNISGTCYIGDGIYKSTDGGNTWTNMGLNNQHVFSKIIVDPTNSNIVYTSTMGQPFSRDNNRGLYKSINGGASWIPVQHINNETGIIDLVMDPSNSQILYSASFTRIRNNFEGVYYGPECKIWKTINGGTTWTQLTNGLPNTTVGRIGLSISPQNPSILYAIVADISSNVFGVYKTINSGSSWTTIPTGGLGNLYYGFGWFFGKIYVNPTNPNQIYVLGVDNYTTTNNGVSWTLAAQPGEVHLDAHDMQFIDGNTIVLCTDGGIYRTNDNCNSWSDIDNIPVARAYHSNENPHTLEEYWCGLQDNGTAFGNIASINDWTMAYGSDGFQSYVDPIDSNIVYAEAQYGQLVYSLDGGFGFYGGDNGIESSDRRNWDMPYIISHHNHSNLYCGTDKVYKKTSAPSGFWSPISGDLTDGLDNFISILHTITSVSESPLAANKIMAGTGDANVWLTLNDGVNWTNITGALPVRYVTGVKFSPNVLSNLYVTHSGYRDGENIPHIHKSVNDGNTWINISGDLPPVGVNALIIAEGNENLIYVATDIGVYYTINGGINWVRLGNNMPMIPVFDIEFNTAKNKIIAATYARSVQTIDISSITNINNHLDETTSIHVYPNPCTDYLIIEGVMNSTKIEYELYNFKGERVIVGKADASTKIKISLDKLAKGTYIVSVKSKNKSTTKKIVKL